MSIIKLCAGGLAWFVLAAASVATHAAQSGQSPWVGTWKLDPSRSDFTGDTMTYSRTPAGLYHFSDGSTSNYDFAIDGKEYPTSSGARVTWVAAGDKAWDNTVRLAGGAIMKMHRELSDGDNTLTITATGTRPDGSTSNDELVFKRVSGTKGLLGKWRDVKSTPAGVPEEFVVTSPSQDVLHWLIPQNKESAEGRMDGTDLPIKGPNVPPGMTFSGKLEAANKLAYVLKMNGKPVQIGTQTIAADGASFTDVSYSPGKQDEKSTGVYLRQ